MTLEINWWWFLSSMEVDIRKRVFGLKTSGNHLVVVHVWYTITRLMIVLKLLLNVCWLGWIINKGHSPGTHNEGFIEVLKKNSGGNNGGNKDFKSISLKSKLVYRLKSNRPITSPSTTHNVDTNVASTSRIIKELHHPTQKENEHRKASIFFLLNTRLRL